MNNTTTTMKNSLEGINILQEAEEQISKMEGRLVEITDTEQNNEKRIKGGQSKRMLRQHYLHQHSHYTERQKNRERVGENISRDEQLKPSLTWERNQSLKSRKHK